MSGVSGRFLVIHADAEAAVLRAVDTGRIYTVAGHPDLCEEMVIVATLSPADAVEAIWSIDGWEEYPVTVVTVEDPPRASARDAVVDADTGSIRRLDRAWGELHVMVVPDVATAIADIRGDPATRSRAARLDAHRVVLRGDDGIVTVAYRRTSEA